MCKPLFFQINTPVVSEFEVLWICGALPYLGMHKNLWCPVRICSTSQLQKNGHALVLGGWIRVDRLCLTVGECLGGCFSRILGK